MLQIKKLRAKRRGTYKGKVLEHPILAQGGPDVDNGKNPSNVNLPEPPIPEHDRLPVIIEKRNTGQKPDVQSKLAVTEHGVPSESNRTCHRMVEKFGIEVESKNSDDQIKETSSIESAETTKSSKSIINECDIDIESKAMSNERIGKNTC